MTMRTLRDILRLALPEGTHLRTHPSGLMRPIFHVTTLRATLPAFPILRGGDLLILSLSELETISDTLTLHSVITRFMTVPVGGLAVIGAVDDAAIAAANAANLPVILLPPGSDSSTVLRETELLLDHYDLQVERRSARLYSKLTALVAQGAGIGGILQATSEATGCVTAFYDAYHQLQSTSSNPDMHSILLEFNPTADGIAYYNDYALLICTIVNTRDAGNNPEPYGFLVICGYSIDAWDEAAATQAMAAMMLEMAKQQAVVAVESRHGNVLYTVGLNTQNDWHTDIDHLREQALRRSYDISQTHVALLIAPADEEIRIEDLSITFEQELRRQCINAPRVRHDQTILCMYPVDDRNIRLSALLRRLNQQYAVGVGISKVTDSRGWQQAQTEAGVALTLGSMLFGSIHVTFYEDLSVYQLLYAMRQSAELHFFHNETLGALIAYDRQHHTALLPTLEAYFAAHGTLSQAATQLQIHRNTLVYRLRRISEISGADLERSDNMLALQIALRAHRVMYPVSEHSPIVATPRV